MMNPKTTPLALFLLLLSCTASRAADEGLKSGSYLLTLTPTARKARSQALDVALSVRQQKGQLVVSAVDMKQFHVTAKVVEKRVQLVLNVPQASVVCTGVRQEADLVEGRYRITVDKAARRSFPTQLLHGSFVLKAWDPKKPPADYVERQRRKRKRIAQVTVVSALRSLVTNNEIHRVKHGIYAPKLDVLETDSYIRASLERVRKLNYDIVYRNTEDGGWTIHANPRKQGYDAYFVDSSGAIRYSSNGSASATSPELKD